MVEPKWRDINSVRESMYREGQWAWVNQAGYSMSARHEKLTYSQFASQSVKDGKVYGPIPDQPKDLPVGRRFKANHKNLGPVSGVYVKERSPVLLDYQVLYWEKDLLRDCWTEGGYLCDIEWMDEE